MGAFEQLVVGVGMPGLVLSLPFEKDVVGLARVSASALRSWRCRAPMAAMPTAMAASRAAMRIVVVVFIIRVRYVRILRRRAG